MFKKIKKIGQKVDGYLFNEIVFFKKAGLSVSQSHVLMMGFSVGFGLGAMWWGVTGILEI